MRRLAARSLLLAAGYAATVSPAAAAPVMVGQSGWAWGSPRPQGNALHAVDFSTNGRGYAAGAFGTVLRTEDGGVSWAGVATGRTTNFTRLAVLGPDAFVVGGGCTLRRSDDGGRTFKRLPFAASESDCPSPLAAISFPTPQNGTIVLTDGTVLRTDDGGETFARRTSVPESQSAGGAGSPGELLFSTPDEGLALVRSGPSTQIHRTTDGGSTWTHVHTTAPLFALTRTPDLGPIYAGGSGVLLVSFDGGLTWEPRALGGAPANTTVTSIRCSQPHACLMATAAGTRILVSTDFGETVRVVTAASEPLHAVAFAAGAPIAVGARGAMVRSGDGGQSFERIGGELAGRYTRVRAGAGDLAFAPGIRGALARSTDGGATWAAGTVSTSLDVVDAGFASPTIGFALDAAGTLFRTDNAGSSWRILGSGPGGRATSVLPLDAKTVLLSGAGGLRRSANGGNLFDRVGSADTRREALSQLERAGTAVLAYGRHRLFVSANGGRSWRAVRRPYKKITVQAADFVSASLGFVLDDRGRVFKTRNRGRTWTELLSAGASPAVGLSFADSRTGWIVIESYRGSAAGWVLRTDDGGRTLRPQLVAPTTLSAQSFGTPTLATLGSGKAVAFSPGIAGPDDDYSGGGTIVSGPQSFFTTTSGGDAGREPALTLRKPRGRVRRGKSARVMGRLIPADGGEAVLVSIRVKGSSVWRSIAVQVASDGRFTLTRKFARTSYLVAQWAGDDERAGAASPVLTVGVR